jgi:hypothetical protein
LIDSSEGPSVHGGGQSSRSGCQIDDIGGQTVKLTTSEVDSVAEYFYFTVVELDLVFVHLNFTTTELISAHAVLIRRSVLQGFYSLI